jgi:hypothetical protein
VRGCEHLDYAPCDTLQTSCQTLRLELAACLRGSEPGELPPVMLISEAEYADLLTDWTSQNPRPNPDHAERTFSLLGLVAPGAFQPAPLVMTEVKRIWGFYDDKARNITLIDHGSPAADARSNVVLLHELVHALQDRDVPLASYIDPKDSADRVTALRSVIEGEARFHEDRYAAALSGLDPAAVDWLDLSQRRIKHTEDWALGQSSPWLALRDLFPYDYGERFAHFAWQSGGHEAVLELFANPPASSWALMASTDEPREPPPGSELPGPTPPEGFTHLYQDELGALGLLVALAHGESAEQFRSAALAWRADGLATYSGPETPAGTAVVWQIELADEATATDVASRLREVVSGSWVERQGTRVIVALATASISLEWAFSTP